MHLRLLLLHVAAAPDGSWLLLMLLLLLLCCCCWCCCSTDAAAAKLLGSKPAAAADVAAVEWAWLLPQTTNSPYAERPAARVLARLAGSITSFGCAFLHST